MYPKKVALFVPWAKAMVQGATVSNPDYGKKRAGSKQTGSKIYKTRRRRRKRRRTRAKKKET